MAILDAYKLCWKDNERGVAKAKAEGKYKGRKPIAMDRQREVIRLVMSGMSKANVAKQLGVGEASVYRILKRSTENFDSPACLN